MTENFAPTATWLAEQSALLRGLAHALSNRVGTVVTATGLLVPGGGASPTIVGVLREEGDRLEALLGLVRVLAGAGGEAEHETPEPIHLPDLVTPAVELHAQHPTHRDVPVTVDADPQSPPVRARHGGLTRALLVLLSAAKQGAPEGVRIAWRGDGDSVALTFDGAVGTEATAAAARGLLGAPVEASVAGYLVRLPRV